MRESADESPRRLNNPLLALASEGLGTRKRRGPAESVSRPVVDASMEPRLSVGRVELLYRPEYCADTCDG